MLLGGSEARWRCNRDRVNAVRKGVTDRCVAIGFANEGVPRHVQSLTERALAWNGDDLWRKTEIFVGRKELQP